MSSDEEWRISSAAVSSSESFAPSVYTTEEEDDTDFDDRVLLPSSSLQKRWETGAKARARDVLKAAMKRKSRSNSLDGSSLSKQVESKKLKRKAGFKKKTVLTASRPPLAPRATSINSSKDDTNAFELDFRLRLFQLRLWESPKSRSQSQAQSSRSNPISTNDFLSFSSYEDYRDHFSDLLFEDLAACLRAGKEDHFRVKDFTVEMYKRSHSVILQKDKNSCFRVRLKCDDKGRGFDVHDAVIVTIAKKCEAGKSPSPKNSAESQAPLNFVAVVSDAHCFKAGVSLTLVFAPHDEETRSRIRKLFESERLSELIQADKRTSSYLDISLLNMGTTITTIREYVAIRSCESSPLMPYIMAPDTIVVPEQLNLPQPCWDRVPPGLMDRLASSLNSEQLRAVQRCSSFEWPVSLLQGPPGTGKTKTVLHLLNVLHLTNYQAHYASVINASMDTLRRRSEKAQKPPKPSPATSSTTPNAQDCTLSSLFDMIDQANERLARTRIVPRPRLLVCAPSNAAVDEIISRVAVEGLVDGNCRPYTPDMIRIGNTSRMRQSVQDAMSLDSQVDAFLRYSPTQLSSRIAQFQNHRIDVQQRSNAVLGRARVAQLQHAGSMALDLSGFATEITHLAEDRYRIGLELHRLSIVRDYDRGTARDHLRKSFFDEAQIVFTTLSGSASRFLLDMHSTRGFDICVVDEAAQCIEASTLLPLSGLAIKAMILVGDPRQLPATVFMAGDKARLHERSLFERLQQAGIGQSMLTIQYRMHPKIRMFPSKFFYDNKLEDGENTTGQAWQKPYHSNFRFQPYVFYDLKSRELRAGRSLRNQDEALFIVNLLSDLVISYQDILPDLLASSAIITPYREQVQEITRQLQARIRFDKRLPALQNVEVSTVDGFQGREKDIIVYSCVRGGNTQIGFVKDLRRMNVAITRAKYSLWVVGNQQTLSKSFAWKSLIADAKSRQCFIEEPIPR